MTGLRHQHLLRTIKSLSLGVLVVSPQGGDGCSSPAFLSDSIHHQLGDADGDGYADCSRTFELCDCADADPGIHPGQPEPALIDGIDQDCNGVADDIVNDDGDAHIDNTIDGGDDCDDTRSDVFPGAEEIPYDGVDQDCLNGDLVDQDGDEAASTSVPGGDDCDDQDPDVNPGSDEVINQHDDDCDSKSDEGIDDDGDTYLDVAYSGGDDCNDADSDIHPDSIEIPYDGVDQDCVNGDLVDQDGDGATSTTVPGGDDCDDTNPAINQHSTPDDARSSSDLEGLDDDCDGRIDEGDSLEVPIQIDSPFYAKSNTKYYDNTYSSEVRCHDLTVNPEGQDVVYSVGTEPNDTGYVVSIEFCPEYPNANCGTSRDLILYVLKDCQIDDCVAAYEIRAPRGEAVERSWSSEVDVYEWCLVVDAAYDGDFEFELGVTILK